MTVGAEALKPLSSLNLSNTCVMSLYFVQLRIAKVKERLPYSCDSTSLIVGSAWRNV